MCTGFEGKSSCAAVTPPIATSARARIDIRIQVIFESLGRSWLTLTTSGWRAKTRYRHMASDGGLISYGPNAFAVKRTYRWLHEATVAALMTSTGPALYWRCRCATL